MLDAFAMRTVAAALFALSTVTLAASASQEYTYWTTGPRADFDTLSNSLWSCSSEVATIYDYPARYYLHRAPSSERCAASLSGPNLPEGGKEVVLFKREPLAHEDKAQTDGLKRSWKMRSIFQLTRIEEETFSGIGTAEKAGQMAFSLSPSSRPSPHKLRVLTADDTALVVAMDGPTLATIDLRATFDTRLQRLNFHPTSSLTALEDKNKERPEPTYPEPKHNSIIARIASSSALSPARILHDLRILTGESAQPNGVGEWHSRHSSTYGARRAGKWIKSQLQESLKAIGGECVDWEYSPYFAPNVICKIPASQTSKKEEKGMVLVSAHYDSRGTFGSTTAPGGDDDGSGTAALLAIARTLGSSNLTLESPLQLIAFSGEEQGLVGSQHYANHLSSLSPSPSIKLALQMDMLAYRKPGEPMQIAFPDKLATASATKYIWNLAEIYAPELEQGYTPACCSDHQSFWEHAFPATWVFERNGPIADPMYHNSGDTTNRTGYDLDQLASIAKVVTTTILDLAGFNL